MCNNVAICKVIGRLLLMMMGTLSINARGQAPPVCSPPCLYFSNTTSIGSIEYRTGSKSVTVSSAARAVAVAADVQSNLMFWTDVVFRRISRINLTNGQIDHVATRQVGTCDGIEVEWENKFVYWTDTLHKRVEVARYNGSDRRILFSTGVDKPRGIALDPRHGYMFWTDWGSSAKIERATLSGQDRKTIIDQTKFPMHWPNDIVISFTENTIYWVDAHKDLIAKADFNGNNRQIVGRFAQNAHPFSIELYNNILFWSDWSSQSIEVMNKDSLVHLVKYGDLTTDKVMGLTMFDQSRQPKGSQICRNNNGGCSHLCFIAPGGRNCACPNGIALNSDGLTCQQDYTNFLLLADRDSQTEKFLQISLDVPNALTEPLPITTNVINPLALDFDPEEERIYWTDVNSKKIYRAFLNGSAQEVLIGTGLVTPAGLAIDPVGQNIYWTDFSTKNIETAKMNGSRRTVLATADRPRDILLDSDRGVMYWTDRGSLPKIEQADMDGKNRKTLVNFQMLFPNSLALDKVNNRLYWADGGKAIVEYIQLDQPNQRVTVIRNNYTLSHPFGLTIFNQYLYFTDWFQLTVVRVDRTSKHQEVIVRGLKKPAEIRAFRRNTSLIPAVPPSPPHSPPSSPTVTSDSTRKSFTFPLATSVPPTSSCAPDTCRNGGVCFPADDGKHLQCLCKRGYGAEKCDVFIGDNAVNITVRMILAKWNEALFQASIAMTLNDYCAERDCDDRSEKAHVSNRSSGERVFEPKDVLVVEYEMGPDNVLFVLFAVADQRITGNSSSVLPAGLVSRFVKEKADQIGKHLGAKVDIVKGPRTQAPTGNTAGAPPEKGSGAPGQTIGIAVGVVVALLLAVILAFLLWRRQNNVRGRPQLANHVWNRFGPNSSISNPAFNDEERLYASAVENPRHVVDDSQFEQLRFPQQESNYAKLNNPLSTTNASPGAVSVPYIVSKTTANSEYQELNKKPGENGGFVASREYENPSLGPKHNEDRNAKKVLVV